MEVHEARAVRDVEKAKPGVANTGIGSSGIRNLSKRTGWCSWGTQPADTLRLRQE
jgi:hypothetical protein